MAMPAWQLGEILVGQLTGPAILESDGRVA
jgi:hypothetical protein